MADTLTIEEACHSILGDQAAHGIITEQGIHWAVVAAMAAATTADDPRALAAIRRFRAEQPDAELDALVALGEGITPGPWGYSFEKRDTGFEGDTFMAGPLHCDGTAGFSSIIEGGLVLADDNENEANARAIAAVPRLIAALTTLRKQRDGLRKALDDAADMLERVGRDRAHRLHNSDDFQSEVAGTASRARQALSNMEGE